MGRSLMEDAFAHQVWATLRLVDTCRALSPQQPETTVPGTYGPILDTLRHLVGSDAWDLFSGEVAHHTGDGLFVAFPDARSALTSAMAVKRALADRRAHGFSPPVRVGIHLAEATRRGRDFSGGEVHKAARIAATEGDEILAGAETVADVRDGFTWSEPRQDLAKGIPLPVEVCGVQWQRSGSGPER